MQIKSPTYGLEFSFATNKAHSHDVRRTEEHAAAARRGADAAR